MKIKNIIGLYLVFLCLVFYFPTIGESESSGSSSCYESSRGHVIDWQEGTKLKWSDFKADSKKSSGFAIATSTSDFEYETRWEKGELRINVHVNFYCHQSWKNPRFHIDDVLDHEQLHFDICELFGRKFFREVTILREEERLNRRTAWRAYKRINRAYQDYQVLYDEETDHSTNGRKQREWQQQIREALDELSGYGQYKEFSDEK